MISKGRVIRVGLFFALANFLLTALVGVILRFNSVFPISEFNDRYWIHAHSHVGFLGWIFIALLIMAFAFLLPKGARINQRMNRLMIYVQISVMGMLVTFPFMGYAAPSILFSSFHMILSVLFVYMFYKYADKSPLCNKFMKAGLILMLISSAGPLALGPIIIGGYRDTQWYEMAVYFYLHFQYNGWFTMGILALLIRLLEQQGVTISPSLGKLLFNLLVIGIIMTLALSALGFGFKTFAQAIGLVGATIQLLAAYFILRIIFTRISLKKNSGNHYVHWLFGIALISWLLKIIMQFLSAIPVITDFVYLSRDAIMTYLHLSFLGFASCFLIGFFIMNDYLSLKPVMARAGYVLFLIGIVLMELTIGLRSIPQYLNVQIFMMLNYALLIEALLLFVSLLFILFYGFILSNRSMKHRVIS